MSNELDVSCPECHKKIAAPAELRGKKVRCKSCGHVFAVPAAAAPARPQAAEERYDLAKDEKAGIPLCPECAKELESEDVIICIHCGFNLKTRQKLAVKKIIDATPGERLLWLSPGFACLISIFVLLGLDLFYWVKVPKLVKDGDLEFLSYVGIQVWVVIFSFIAIYFLARFAYQRLVREPNPPERTLR